MTHSTLICQPVGAPDRIAGTAVFRPFTGAGRYRVWTRRVLLAIFSIFAPMAGVQAADPEVFAVRGVAVDATARTATQARDDAIAAGQVAALSRLFARLTLAGDRAKLPPPTLDTVNDLVKDFEVADEKTSAVRYLASLTVRFRPDGVRALLRERGVGFAETRSKPLLVLPVMEVVGALALWDEPNPWRAAWGRLPLPDGLVPLVQARGDLQDVAVIGAEQAVRGDDKRLSAIARRYGAADVLVARAAMRYPDTIIGAGGAGAEGGAGSGPWLQVTLSRFGLAQLEQTRVESFYPEPGESAEVLYARAAAAIARQVQENWKINNRLRFDTGDELTVDVPLASLAEWLLIKGKLDSVPLIRRSDLVFMTRKAARLRLNFIGDVEQLRLALTQSDLSIEQGTTSLVLRLAPAPEEPATP